VLCAMYSDKFFLKSRNILFHKWQSLCHHPPLAKSHFSPYHLCFGLVRNETTGKT
jgi:hypothetical protein